MGTFLDFLIGLIIKSNYYYLIPLALTWPLLVIFIVVTHEEEDYEIHNSIKVLKYAKYYTLIVAFSELLLLLFTFRMGVLIIKGTGWLIGLYCAAYILIIVAVGHWLRFRSETFRLIIFSIVFILHFGYFGYLLIKTHTVTYPEWVKYKQFGNPYERLASTKYFYSKNNLDELHYLLHDSEPSVARGAFEYIWKLHDVKSIPVLISFLEIREVDDLAKEICEIFLNCGNLVLEEEGKKWANDHGLTIIHQPTNSSPQMWKH